MANVKGKAALVLGKKEEPKVAEKEKPKVEEIKENPEPVTNGTAPAEPPPPEEEDEHLYDVSSSESEDDGPPPMIQIGDRSTDLGTLKTAIMAPKDAEPLEREQLEGVGAENLSTIKGAFETTQKEEEPKKEREKLTVGDKEKYSKFKNRFEHLNEDLAKAEEEKKKSKEVPESNPELQEKISSTKSHFETLKDAPAEPVKRDPIEVQRSEVEKRRVEKTFNQPPEEESRDCAVCGKMVYSMEKLLAEKKVFHKQCFRCSKCGKSLGVTSYNSHEGRLLCKIHMLEIFHPEMALNFNPDDEAALENLPIDEESEYAKVSQPKSLDPSIVRSGFKTTDDLETLQSAKVLQSAKMQWEQSQAEQQARPERESIVIEGADVKSRLSRFSDSGAGAAAEEEEEEEAEGALGVVRGSRKPKKEVLNFEVGSIKSKWEKGEVETAECEMTDRSQELSQLKGVSVKERFKEKTAPEEHAVSSSNQEPIDTSFSSSARERFQKGEAFQDSAPVDRTANDVVQFKELGNVKEKFEKGELEAPESVAEKTQVDVRCAELGNIKAAFEGAKPEEEDEEAAELKRIQLEEEFKRFKKERRKQEMKEQREKDEANPFGIEVVPYKNPEDIRQCAEMSSIKQRFEAGTAFQSENEPKKQEDLEMKVAGKARDKFMRIDAETPGAPVIPAPQRQQDSKWNKDDKPVPEPINRRQTGDSDSEEEGNFEVRNLLSKFKNIEKQEETEERKGPKPVRQITPPPEGYKAELESSVAERDPNVVTGEAAEPAVMVRTDAKNLKARFEQGISAAEPEEDPEEKRKRLEEEFKRYKEAKASEEQEEGQTMAEALEAAKAEKEVLGIAPEHANKMKQKWEKLHKKETKKAQKSQMQRTPRALLIRAPPAHYCFVCDRKVYQAELVESDGRWFHRLCFKCKTCKIALRIENSAAGPDGIYCRTHHQEMFNNLARPLFDGRRKEGSFASPLA